MKRRTIPTVVFDYGFMSMPGTSQALYIHLAARADDDGFVDTYKSIAKMIQADTSDINNLIKYGFVYLYQSGAVVIRHWALANYIRKERYTPTKHQKELSLLDVTDGIYKAKADDGFVQVLDDTSKMADECQTYVRQMSDQCQTNVRPMSDICEGLNRENCDIDNKNIYSKENDEQNIKFSHLRLCNNSIDGNRNVDRNEECQTNVRPMSDLCQTLDGQNRTLDGQNRKKFQLCANNILLLYYNILYILLKTKDHISILEDYNKLYNLLKTKDIYINQTIYNKLFSKLKTSLLNNTIARDNLMGNNNSNGNDIYVNNINNNNKDTCNNKKAKTKELQVEAVIKIPCVKGEEFSVSQDMVDEWSGFYPAVDVMQELRKMIAWSRANPTRMKTKRGISRFINSWLSRSQDNARPSYKGNTESRNSKYVISNVEHILDPTKNPYEDLI